MVQLVAPADEVLPAAHATHTAALVGAPPVAAVPAGQGVHAASPAAAHVPGGHGWQLVCVAFGAVPAPQTRHELLLGLCA
jgi:hypothetical protein